jgi:hypothetical protein
MKEAEIAIAVFPQADSSLKRRPALILREVPPFRDFLICGINTQIRQKVEDFDEIISPGAKISKQVVWRSNHSSDSAFCWFYREIKSSAQSARFQKKDTKNY